MRRITLDIPADSISISPFTQPSDLESLLHCPTQCAHGLLTSNDALEARLILAGS
jgi:hypothetical protein